MKHVSFALRYFFINNVPFVLARPAVSEASRLNELFEQQNYLPILN